MTRVAIIGNSHVGAYVEAQAAINAAFPQVELSFFGFPRHKLTSARYGRDGVLAVVGQHNTHLPQRIDLSAQDHILMVGQPIAMIRLNALLARFDVLGWARHGLPQSVSPTLMAEFVAEAVAAGLDRLMKYFRRDARFTFAPQPLIGRSTPPGTSKMTDVAHHPEAARIFALWEAAITGHMADAPCAALLQPPHLRDGVFTPHRFTRAAALPDPGQAGEADFIHMNADYGLEHFRVFAENRLGAQSAPGLTPS